MNERSRSSFWKLLVAFCAGLLVRRAGVETEPVKPRSSLKPEPSRVDERLAHLELQVTQLQRESIPRWLKVGALIGEAVLVIQLILFALQFYRQDKDTNIVRRAQLLATIYDCGEPEPERQGVPPTLLRTTLPFWICTPKEQRRARQEAVLAFAELERGRGRQADLSRTNLSGLNLDGIDLREADLGLAYLRWAHLQGANLHKANLFMTDFNRSSLTGADLSGTDLKQAYLSGALLKEADLRDSHLNEADLSRADLREAKLGGADLRGADLQGADLGDTNLQDADIRGANLESVRNLSLVQIHFAWGDADTKLPPNLGRPTQSARWPKADTSPDPSQEP